MCFSAIHWSRIKRIIYGTTIKDARKLGFNELGISAEKMRKDGKSSLKIYGNFLRDESLDLLKEWKRLERKKTY